MDLLLRLLFCINVGLFISHEMDAIRCKEWGMFIFLKDMKEDIAYLIFSIVHIPFYAGLLYLVAYGSSGIKNTFSIILDVFLIFHCIIHFAFRNKQQNFFKNRYSLSIINLMGAISIIHMIL